MLNGSLMSSAEGAKGLSNRLFGDGGETVELAWLHDKRWSGEGDKGKTTRVASSGLGAPKSRTILDPFGNKVYSRTLSRLATNTCYMM